MSDVSNKEILDSIINYTNSRKLDGTARSTPPAVSTEQYAEIAVANLEALIDRRINAKLEDFKLDYDAGGMA